MANKRVKNKNKKVRVLFVIDFIWKPLEYPETCYGDEKRQSNKLIPFKEDTLQLPSSSNPLGLSLFELVETESLGDECPEGSSEPERPRDEYLMTL